MKMKSLLKTLILILFIGVNAPHVGAQTLSIVKSVKNASNGGDGSTASQGQTLLYTIIVKNTSSLNFKSSYLYDFIPAGVTYIANSTKANGVAVADVGGLMPYSIVSSSSSTSGGMINTTGNTAGVLGAGKSDTITFQVKVSANSGSIQNYATINTSYSNTTQITTKQSNTVFTNLIQDPLCAVIFQSTDVTAGNTTYSRIRQLDTTNGNATTTYYDGATGISKDALTGATISQVLTNTAAIAYDRFKNRIYFVNQGSGTPLSYIELIGSTFQGFSYVGYPLSTSSSGINRMGFASDSMGYALTSDGKHLIRFYIDEASQKPVITDLGSLINDASNTKDVLSEDGGDVYGDGNGKLYMIVHSGALYKIKPSTRVATYLGTVTGASSAINLCYALALNADGTVFMGGGVKDVYKINMATMATTKVNNAASLSVFMSGDYTSCSFPVLSSNIVATKTYVNLNGSSTVTGGDTVKYIITISNTGNINAAGVKLYDYIPASTHYRANSTTLNGLPVADISGVMRYAVTGGSYINSLNDSAGIVKPGATNAAVVTFQVITDPLKTVCNQSKITLLNDDGNLIFVNSSDPDSASQTPTCFITDELLALGDLKFKGSLVNGQSVLTWSMPMDENVARYEVEYSDNGNAFTTIGSVPGKGNTGVLNNYQFKDVVNNFSTTRFYRLRVVQKGGTYDLSGVIRLDLQASDKARVAPNPFDRTLNLQFQMQNRENVRIRLLDFYGREVYSTNEQVAAGGSSMILNLPTGLAKGFYVLDVSTANTTLFQKKLIKQ